MNIIRRALRRITRQYKQSILLFLVLVILFLFYGSAWVIDIAANNLEKDIKEKIGAYVIVSKPGSTVESSSPLASFSSMRSLAQTMSLNYPVHYYDISLQEMVAPAKNESDILVLKGVEQCPGLPFFEGTIALVNGNALDENSDVNAAIISVEVAKRYDCPWVTALI